MSDFWSSDLGEVTGKPDDAFASLPRQIPDGTTALAKITKFSNAEFNDSKYLQIEWTLIGGDFVGQKVQQKLKVWDSEPKVRHRALNMLKLMYNLYEIKPKHAGSPADHDLNVFVGKTAGIKIRETEPNDKGKQYNWVAEIHEAKGFKCETGIGLPVKAKTTIADTMHFYDGGVDSAFSRSRAELDNDVPF